MDTVVMKYISVTIRDTLLTVGIWMLVPVEVGDGQKRVSDDVLNLPKFRSWWGCSELPSKCRSTAETAMNPIGQTIPVIHLHLEGRFSVNAIYFSSFR